MKRIVLAGCGKAKEERANPIKALTSQKPGVIPDVWNHKICDQACEDADMGRPNQNPKNRDYNKCYKECD